MHICLENRTNLPSTPENEKKKGMILRYHLCLRVIVFPSGKGTNQDLSCSGRFHIWRGSCQINQLQISI